MKAWLGLGANLQQPEKQLTEALQRLNAADGIEVLRISSFYRTSPWGDEQQGDFVNAVALVSTSLEPLSLLRVMQSIETGMGRQRKGRRWGPRLIDIDLLLYGNQQTKSEELQVPHPRMHERAFVLVPLCELDASLEIPGIGAVNKLLQQVDRDGIYALCENDRE